MATASKPASSAATKPAASLSATGVTDLNEALARIRPSRSFITRQKTSTTAALLAASTSKDRISISN